MISEMQKIHPNILVIGDLMIDNYLWGETNRISPEAPVQIVNVERETKVLGGAGNVAHNLKTLGANVEVLSVIGGCEISEQLQHLLREVGINSNNLVVQNDRITSKKTRIISSHQQVIRYDIESAEDISIHSEKLLIDKFKSILKNFDLVILSDYGKGVLTEYITQEVINTANSNKIKVIVDPKGSDYSKYKSAHLLTPNKIEASEATGINISDEKSLINALTNLKENYELNCALITLSEEGIAIYDDKFSSYPTLAKEVFDVTGAGDTVIAALGYALAANLDISEAVIFANLAAGIVVGKIGSATTSFEEIANYELSLNLPLSEQKIVSSNQLMPILDEYKKNNKQIVFTNGCFDILHAGHVRYLENAKKLGDILIVGINSDDSVKRLKGKSRPINSLDDRSLIIASLSSVDYVVSFEEDTPLNLIKSIVPDILVKGGDYKDKDVIGSNIAKKLVIIDFIEGKSTSNTIMKILEND